MIISEKHFTYKKQNSLRRRREKISNFDGYNNKHIEKGKN